VIYIYIYIYKIRHTHTHMMKNMGKEVKEQHGSSSRKHERCPRRPFLSFDEWVTTEFGNCYDYLGISEGAPVEEAKKACDSIIANFTKEVQMAYDNVQIVHMRLLEEKSGGKKGPQVAETRNKASSGSKVPVTPRGREAATKRPLKQDGELNPILQRTVKRELNSDDSDSDSSGDEIAKAVLRGSVRADPGQVPEVIRETQDSEPPKDSGVPVPCTPQKETREEKENILGTSGHNRRSFLEPDSRLYASFYNKRHEAAGSTKKSDAMDEFAKRMDATRGDKGRSSVSSATGPQQTRAPALGPRLGHVPRSTSSMPPPPAPSAQQPLLHRKREHIVEGTGAAGQESKSRRCSMMSPAAGASSLEASASSSRPPCRVPPGHQDKLPVAPRHSGSSRCDDDTGMKRRKHDDGDDHDVIGRWRETDDDHGDRATGSTNEPSMEFNQYPKDRFFECPHEAPVRMTGKEERRFKWATGNSTHSGKACDFVDLSTMDTQVLNPHNPGLDEDEDDDRGFDRTKFIKGNLAWEAAKRKCEKRDALRLKKAAFSLMGYRAVLGTSYAPPLVLLKSKDLLKVDSHIVDSRGFIFGRNHAKAKSSSSSAHNPILISLEHFRITVPTIGTVTLSDLSSNGTFYKMDNGERTQVPARPGNITLPLRQDERDSLSIIAGDYEFTVEAVWFEKAAALEMAERAFIALLNEKAEITQNVLRESDIGREIGRWLKDARLPLQESAQKVMTKLKTKCQQTMKK